MAISSNRWLLIWVGLELNLLSFIPLISASSINQETEASVKYFLVQAIGSATLLFILAAYKLQKPLIDTIMFMALALKAGMAPCYRWFPQVIASMDWFICLLLSTIQKLAPLLLLFGLINRWNSILLTTICFINRLVGGAGGLNQTQIRPLLAYSSIAHISWITAARAMIVVTALSYLFIYIVITIRIIALIMNISKTSTGQYNISLLISGSSILIMALSFLSLAGLPPLLGFLPKWIVMSLLSPTFPLLTAILILGSLITLFYYLLVVFSSNLNIMKRTILSPTAQTQNLTLTLSVSFFWLALILVSALTPSTIDSPPNNTNPSIV